MNNWLTACTLAMSPSATRAPSALCECYAIESHRVEYRGRKEVVVGVDYGVVHMARSGDSAGYSGGYKDMAEAEAAARLEARRRDCVLISSEGQA